MRALELISKVLEGFEHHPHFFVLNTAADPPVLPFAHQVELLFRLSLRRPVRILIGDEIGLGKTIEAILAVKLLEKRDGIKRVLVLSPRILIEQWKSELKRFNIHASVIERGNVSSLASQGFPGGWYVASIDLLKREEHKRKIVNACWDVVVVDEAHRVGAARLGSKSVTQRYELVEELVRDPKRHVILLSATPHRGHVEDYISRLKLVDPYLLGEEELDDEGFYRLTRDSILVRRTKIDVNEVYEREQVFKKARFVAVVVNATDKEVEFSEALFSFLREKLLKYYELTEEEPRPLPLLLALVTKRASSSPYAALVTLERILRKRSFILTGRAQTSVDAARLDSRAKSIAEAYLGPGFEDYGEVDEQVEAVVEPDDLINAFAEECSVLLEEPDLEELERLFKLSETIAKTEDSRLRGVFKIVNEHLSRGDRVVVFTEYKDTAKYIYNKIAERMASVAGATALITSERIVVPGWGGRREPSIEDVKKSLRSGKTKLIVSTDIASEGLNLQVANVVINYEPTWSPVKIEQRLGRVWRLGQEKDVLSYTVFLATKSDMEVLEVLYKKLLAWGRSLQESKVAVGEEVVIDFSDSEESTAIPLDAVKGVPKYSEYRALLAYLQRGRTGLEEYVQSIVNALVLLKKNLEKVGLSRRDISQKTEKLISEVLGDFRGKGVKQTLKEMFVTVAKLRGINVSIEGDRVFAGSYRLENLSELYNRITEFTRRGEIGGSIYLVSSAQLEDLKEVHLFRVVILFGNMPVYSETLGVGVKDSSTVLIRGKNLLDMLAKALSPDYLVSAVHEYELPKELLLDYKVRASKNVLKEIVSAATKEFMDYTSRLEKLGLSSPHLNWEPKNVGVYTDSIDYVGTVIFTTPSREGTSEPPPPVKVEEVEKAAMGIALDYERSSNRVPEDVSAKEHFDILSRNPHTGEMRFIEVKGKSGLDLEIELTETEFNVAKEKKDNYWLYVVYGIGLGKPRLLAVRDPVNNMNWREVSVRRYRFRPK